MPSASRKAPDQRFSTAAMVGGRGFEPRPSSLLGLGQEPRDDALHGAQPVGAFMLSGDLPVTADHEMSRLLRVKSPDQLGLGCFAIADLGPPDSLASDHALQGVNILVDGNRDDHQPRAGVFVENLLK